MTETASRLREELSQLSLEERAEMAYLLIESLDAGADSDVEAAWDSELARRVEEVRHGTCVGETSHHVFERILGIIK